ncbi:MAG: DUF3127 domain-containing protein [Bacteroidota bacterium]
MNLQGKIVEIFDTQQVKDTFKKREFVVEYAENPQYPEVIKFELIQDRCGLVDNFKKGDDVDVHFNIKGRKWTDPKGEAKYFVSLQAWKLDAVQTGAPQNTDEGPRPFEGGVPTEEPGGISSMEEDDLPF